MNINPLNQINVPPSLAETEFSRKKYQEAEDIIKLACEDVESIMNSASVNSEDKSKISSIVKNLNDRILNIVAKYRDNLNSLSDNTRTNLQQLITSMRTATYYEQDEKVRDIALKELDLVSEMLQNPAASASNTLPVGTTSPSANQSAISSVDDTDLLSVSRPSVSAVLPASALEAEFQAIVRNTSPYNEYRIKNVVLEDDQGKRHISSTLRLSDFSHTPLEFTESALGITANPRAYNNNTIMYFLNNSFVNILRNKIFEGSPSKTISIKAPDTILHAYGAYESDLGKVKLDNGVCSGFAKGTDVYGDGVCDISYEEIKRSCQSRQEFTSEKLPLRFWLSLKKAMNQDNIYILPGGYGNVKFLKDLKEFENCKAFLTQVESEIANGGWPDLAYHDFLDKISLHQMATQIVHMQDLYLVCNEDGKIISRKPGTTRSITQVSVAGIRDIRHTDTPGQFNYELIKNAFYTAMRPANKEIMVFPAIGMGIWAGPPEIYWPCFLDAYLDSRINMQALFINPGHRLSYSGKAYAGNKEVVFNGAEFQVYLDMKKEEFKDDPRRLEKLNRIHNLYEDRTDIVQLAHNLAQKFKEKRVFLANASDGDVLMGKCIGEYCKGIGQPSTTEEFNAMMLQPSSLGHIDIAGPWPSMNIKDLDKKTN